MSTSSCRRSSRASAQIRSPSSISRRRPARACGASISLLAPSRSTRARSGRNAASASTARSACSSWTKEKAAFRTITAAIAIASFGVPLAQASAAASASSSASGWVNCPASSPGQLAAPPGQLVGPGDLQPSRRFAAGQAARSRAQVPEQLRHRLHRIRRRGQLAGTRGDAIRPAAIECRRGPRPGPAGHPRTPSLRRGGRPGSDGRATAGSWRTWVVMIPTPRRVRPPPVGPDGPWPRGSSPAVPMGPKS